LISKLKNQRFGEADGEGGEMLEHDGLSAFYGLYALIALVLL
jgi:hypothetical protein